MKYTSMLFGGKPTIPLCAQALLPIPEFPKTRV